MGRSKLGPSLRRSAGARLIVVLPRGILKPELVRAVLTRSRDSLTAVSGRPTMTMTLSPQPAFTSTSTGNASIPLTAAEHTLANINCLYAITRPGVQSRFLGKGAITVDFNVD